MTFLIDWNNIKHKNFQAVKKTRAKSKDAVIERRKNIERLKKENLSLESQIKFTEENIKFLKALLLNKSETDKRTAIRHFIAESR